MSVFIKWIGNFCQERTQSEILDFFIFCIVCVDSMFLVSSVLHLLEVSVQYFGHHLVAACTSYFMSFGATFSADVVKCVWPASKFIHHPGLCQIRIC